MELFSDETTTVKSVLLRCSASASGDHSMTWGDVTGELKPQLYRCKQKLRT